jgi:RimJ/RimL family protein N-acetyltransferase
VSSGDRFVSTPRLRTERLELIAGNAEMAQAEVFDKKRLSSLLDAHLPADWPPPLNDENSAKWFANYLAKNLDAVGWVGWYFILQSRDGRRTAIGNGGFKGKPDQNGIAEIGYSVMQDHQRQGYAPEAVRALLAWAFSHPEVKQIIAHTLPDLNPSISVLQKCGFVFAGKGLEEGTIKFTLPRNTWSPPPGD